MGADDQRILNQFRDLIGKTFEMVDGPEKAQQARLVMTFAPALGQAMREGGLFLCKEGEGVSGGRVVKLRIKGAA